MLAESLLRLDDVGYEVVNCVHDEVLLVCDEKEAEAVLDRVIGIMTTPPKWATNFPIDAEGWISKRYRK
jgi:DNA polymerase